LLRAKSGLPLDCLGDRRRTAGLTAAIYPGRFRRRFAVVDAGDSRALLIPKPHNYAGFPEGIGGRELRARMRAQAENYGLALIKGHGTGGHRRDLHS
jgi:thioredoxin reductase (NADPH)